MPNEATPDARLGPPSGKDYNPEDIEWCGMRVGDMDRATLIKFIGQLDWFIGRHAKREER